MTLLGPGFACRLSLRLSQFVLLHLSLYLHSCNCKENLLMLSNTSSATRLRSAPIRISSAPIVSFISVTRERKPSTDFFFLPLGERERFGSVFAMPWKLARRIFFPVFLDVTFASTAWWQSTPSPLWKPSPRHGSISNLSVCLSTEDSTRSQFLAGNPMLFQTLCQCQFQCQCQCQC